MKYMGSNPIKHFLHFQIISLRMCIIAYFLFTSSTGYHKLDSTRKHEHLDIHTHYNFTIAFLSAVKNYGNGKFVGGAFFLAVEHLNEYSDQILNRTGISATFNYVFRDTYNMETKAVKAMVDLYCNKSLPEMAKVSVFIGPDKFCSSASLLATSFNLPFFSYVSFSFLSLF